jgi:hypothetical protein
MPVHRRYLCDLGLQAQRKHFGPPKGDHHVNLPDTAIKFCLRCLTQDSFRLSRLFDHSSCRNFVTGIANIPESPDWHWGLEDVRLGFNWEPVFRACFTIDKRKVSPPHLLIQPLSNVPRCRLVPIIRLQAWQQ